MSGGKQDAMSTAVKAATAFDQVVSHAESICNDGDHDLATMDIGDEWRQGDVAIIRVDDGFVSANGLDLGREKAPSPQLAPGTTQGSRHTLESLRGVTAYRLKNATPLDGPILVLAEPRAIIHPEHGDCRNLPAGCYVIQYARAFATELRAVQD